MGLLNVITLVVWLVVLAGEGLRGALNGQTIGYESLAGLRAKPMPVSWALGLALAFWLGFVVVTGVILTAAIILGPWLVAVVLALLLFWIFMLSRMIPQARYDFNRARAAFNSSPAALLGNARQR